MLLLVPFLREARPVCHENGECRLASYCDSSRCGLLVLTAFFAHRFVVIRRVDGVAIALCDVCA